METENQAYLFPRTEVGGLSVSRMLIGTNWMLGYSHTSQAADALIRSRYQTGEDYLPILGAYLQYGIDTLMAPLSTREPLQNAIQLAEDTYQKEIIRIDTPTLNVDDTQEARQIAQQQVKQSAAAGSKICLIHHAACEQLMNKNKRVLERLDDYTYMIREAGMIPGLSAHMPEVIPYCDQNGYDIEAYIQIFNPVGFLMQVEIEEVAKNIQRAKKPVMVIKSMAAGRVTPYVGLTFTYNAIRPCDMVTVGAFSDLEVHEDVEIARAAIEHRFPVLGKRSSPAPNQGAFAK